MQGPIYMGLLWNFLYISVHWSLWKVLPIFFFVIKAFITINFEFQLTITIITIFFTIFIIIYYYLQLTIIYEAYSVVDVVSGEKINEMLNESLNSVDYYLSETVIVLVLLILNLNWMIQN